MKPLQLLSASFLSLSVLLFCNCSGSSDTGETIATASNYKLAIVDSIQVDVLASSMTILDVHKETGELLAIQPSPPKLWILSPEGEVKKTWEKSGNGPDEIGSILLSAEFFGDGIAMMGYMQLKIFDRDFKLISSHKPSYDLQGMLYTGFNHLIEFETNEGNQLVTFFGGPQTEAYYDSPEYYEEFNVVDVINPSPTGELELESTSNRGVFKPIGRFEDDSRFKLSGRSYFYIKPVFDVSDKELTYAFNWDTIIYKRKLPSGELISSSPIPFDEFYLNGGWTMGKARAEMNSGNVPPRDRSGAVDGVFNVSDFDVVFYRSGLSLERLQAITVTGTERFKEELRLNYQKYLILKDGKRLNKELKMNDEFNAPMVADNQGYLWAGQNTNILDEEPELITFYKLKIVADEE